MGAPAMPPSAPDSIIIFSTSPGTFMPVAVAKRGLIPASRVSNPRTVRLPQSQ